MITLSYCNKLLDTGYSLVTVGKNKVPNTRWKDCQTSKISKEQFERNYSIKNGSYTNKDNEIIEIQETSKIGICTGFWDVEVIDIDLKILPNLKAQNDFWIEYTNLLKESILDFEDKVVIYQTLTGGYHILYRCKKIGGNEKIARLKEYKEAIIETRGVGGYVVIYDKQISKLAYHEIKEISELDRDTIINCSKFFNYIEVSEKPKEQKKYENSNIIELDKVSPLDDFNNKTDIFDILNLDFDIVKNLSKSIIIKRFGANSASSGHIFKDSNCMYLFSTGTLYPSEKLLSASACYTYKYHNGDFSASAKDLYSKGFGSRIIKKPIELDEVKTISTINFPLEIYPQGIQNYIIDCNVTLDSNIDFMGASFLWMLSVIIGNSCKVEVKRGWYGSVNLWIACVGRAGIGKTPSINNIIFPLKKINNEEIKKYIKQFDKYEAYSALDKKEKERAEEIQKPRKTQFIVNDVTIEALIEIHDENPNAIGVFKDELAGWFKDMNKYRAGSDLEFWLSSWSNQSVSVNRKTSKNSFVESPIIPVLGGIQPSILSNFFTEENKDNGFIDRMLLVFPKMEIEKYNSKEISTDVYTWYSDFIIDMYSSVQKNMIRYKEDGTIDPYLCRFDNEALIEWERIFNKITDIQNSDNESEYFKSMLPKQKDYIPRFALILNILNCLETGESFVDISKKSLLDAEKLSDYFTNEARKIKQDSIVKNEVKKVIKQNENKSNKDKAIEIFKANPSFKKTEIAEMLGVSKQLVAHYLKDVKNV
jgi:hypothetical protein